MKLSLFRTALAAVLATASGIAAAADNARPVLPLPGADQIPVQCEARLSDLRRQVDLLELKTRPRPGDAEKVFSDWNDLMIAFEDFQGPMSILNNLSPDAQVRKNAEACIVEISKFAAELFQREKLYLRFKSVRPRDAVGKKVRQDAMEEFEDAGVSLPPKRRQRMREIVEQLERLTQEFARNVRDNNEKLVFMPDEVKGLPPAYLERAKRDASGNYLLGFDYPEYVPFMEYADNGEARRRYQFAFVNRGTPRNLELLKQVLELRLEMAQLFDLPSYAHFVTRRRMALTPSNVQGFLAEVRGAVTELEKKELEELRQFKAQSLGLPRDQVRMERWDVSYWQQKLKLARYSLDQNALRKHFPTEAALQWALHISGVLYGIEFVPVQVPAWHEDVRYVDVMDSATGRRIGGIYLDLYPREGKYGHAAVWPVRSVSTVAGRTPISVLVANFNRVGLDANELETLVHEFGHALHGVLSTTRYVMQAGTSVERDFVEAPSQMFEEWARRKEPLSLVASFCSTPCPPVDDTLARRLIDAHNYGRGIRYARQLLYATYDMNLHKETLSDPLSLWAEMETSTPLGYVEGTQFPGQFTHLMGGYAAGYYGYMWSEVLALDMLSRFGERLLNPEVGKLYRQTILSRGSEARGNKLVRDFLGREPNNKAFFDEISGKRLH